MTALILSTALGDAGAGIPCAASVAAAIADQAEVADARPGAVLLIELGGVGGRGPTMLASEGARELERELRDAGFEAAARGRLTWLRIAPDDDWRQRLRLALEGAQAPAAVVHLPTARLRDLLDAGDPQADALLLRAELPA